MGSNCELRLWISLVWEAASGLPCDQSSYPPPDCGATGRNEALRSSDLKDFLDIGPGKLYYHLKNLGNLIEQDEKRKYKLSQKGKEAYHLLVAGENLPVKSPRSLPRFLVVLNSIFLPNALFSQLYKHPASHLPERFLLLLFWGWLSHLSGLQPILLFFTTQSQSWYWTIFQFLIGWLIIYTVAHSYAGDYFTGDLRT